MIVDKPGKGAFYATNLDLVLRTTGITHLILTGITTDVCVHTTMREANDRGYECLILSDCTGATDPGNHEAALHMVTMQGGVFGCVATSADVIAATAEVEAPAHRRPSPPRRPIPYTFDPASTALLVIDMQRDFLEPGGFGETPRQRRQPAAPHASRRSRRCWPAPRAAGLTDHPHPRGAPARPVRLPAGQAAAGASPQHADRRPRPPRPDPRSAASTATTSSTSSPRSPGELVIDKPGKGAFYATDLGRS